MSEEIANQHVDVFMGFLEQGYDGIFKAGREYVKAIDENPDYGQAFRDRLPQCAAGVWADFERIGRGQVLAALQIEGSRLCALPMSEQIKYRDDHIQVALDNGDTLAVMHYDLKPDQWRQVNGGDHIRTLPAQRAWLEEQKASDARRQQTPAVVVEPYRVYRGRLEILEPVTLDRKTLARLLSEME